MCVFCCVLRARFYANNNNTSQRKSSGVTSVYGGRGRNTELPLPSPESRHVGPTPTVRFSVKYATMVVPGAVASKAIHMRGAHFPAKSAGIFWVVPPPNLYDAMPP